ncbi:hypothetical protein BS47DRAFT_1370025 [Hydnum rufescens UP504]|uniref:Uncharacterized protein n=1 Tax=Hydnum rufescens UP504 TaxID=1448309 RepID=A0A9P6AB55_9AGAM|nr:hypothetical protein BS47DRAFT_1370025 [Hydnum rufescens UP504]
MLIMLELGARLWTCIMPLWCMIEHGHWRNGMPYLPLHPVFTSDSAQMGPQFLEHDLHPLPPQLSPGNVHKMAACSFTTDDFEMRITLQEQNEGPNSISLGIRRFMMLLCAFWSRKPATFKTRLSPSHVVLRNELVRFLDWFGYTEEFGVSETFGIKSNMKWHLFFHHVLAFAPLQLQARRWATLHVVAFHQQEVLLDITLLLSGSISHWCIPSAHFVDTHSSLCSSVGSHSVGLCAPGQWLEKEKMGSSPPQNSMTDPSSTYTNAFKAGMALFQDVANTCPKPPRRAHHGISKKSVAPKTILPQEPSSSTGRKGPKKLAPIATSSVWKLDEETGTFVTIVPVHKAVNRPARPAISAPHYHRPVSSAMSSVNLHDKECHTSLFSTAVGGDSTPRHEAPLPEAVEHPFSVQYPTYARGLDHFSVEQALSRHARRRAAAAWRWDHEIIPP